MQNVGRQRPLGVSIIAIILGIFAILALLIVILGFFAVGASNTGGALGAAATIALVLAAIFAIAELVLAWGLWTLKAWAFWATVIIEGLRVLDGIFTALTQHNNLASALFSLIIPIIILVYLFVDPNVRAAFRT